MVSYYVIKMLSHILLWEDDKDVAEIARLSRPVLGSAWQCLAVLVCTWLCLAVLGCSWLYLAVLRCAALCCVLCAVCCVRRAAPRSAAQRRAAPHLAVLRYWLCWHSIA